ncbi:MAG: heavy metal translocating P-type ATPase [Deinococcota bacterium]
MATSPVTSQRSSGQHGLEPDDPRHKPIATHSASDEDKREVVIGAVLTLITLLGMITAMVLTSSSVQRAWIIGIYGVTFVAGGLPALVKASGELRQGKLDIDLLMVLAALAAAAVGQARDGAFLLFLFSLANVLEHAAMGNTKRAVSALMKLRPEQAEVLANAQGDDASGDDIVITPIDQVQVEDVVLVRPGATIPVDGEVLTGESAVDQAAVTGESVPVDKQPGDNVFAGTLNQQGALTVRVTKPPQSSTLARMINLVTEAQSQRAPSQRFSDWFGQRYTVAVLVGSALALGLLLLSGLPRQDAFYKAATLLVVASPCAIVISVPAAMLSALAAAARQGMLFKGGAALEDFGNVSVIAFDKTGTLTTGQLELTDIISQVSDLSEDDVLRLAANIETHSEHPIAKSIVRAAQARSLALTPFDNIQAQPGYGLSVTTSEDVYWLGNARLAGQFVAPLADDVKACLARLEQRGSTPLILGQGEARDARVLAVLAVADSPRPQVRDALYQLHHKQRLVMLTGDNSHVANAVASQVGLALKDVYANLLPDEKVACIRELLAQTKGKVAFVGDGVNDAAALAASDVGIAMGAAGSDAALEAADVALLADDLRVLASAQQLARRANRVVRQNLVFAIGIMLVMVVLTLAGNLPLPLGVIGHEGGTLLVVANGLRLLIPTARVITSSA